MEELTELSRSVIFSIFLCFVENRNNLFLFYCRICQEIEAMYQEKNNKYDLVAGEIVIIPLETIPRFLLFLSFIIFLFLFQYLFDYCYFSRSSTQKIFLNKNWRVDYHWEFVFCRISKITGNFVDIFMDPFETMAVTIPRTAVRKLKGLEGES